MWRHTTVHLILNKSKQLKQKAWYMSEVMKFQTVRGNELFEI
jgi:hypothetical protein